MSGHDPEEDKKDEAAPVVLEEQADALEDTTPQSPAKEPASPEPISTPPEPEAADTAPDSTNPPTPPTPTAPSEPSELSEPSEPSEPPPAPAPTVTVAATPAPRPTQAPDAPSKLPAPTPILAPSPGEATPLASLRTAPELAEFDPFATPAPVPKAPKAKRATVEAVETQTPEARLSSDAAGAGSSTGAAEASTSQADGPAGEPAFNFAGFLRDLRSKPADPVARYLKSFLTNFAKKPFTVNEQIKLIRDFLAFITEKMAAVEPWKSQSEAEFDNALEAMEKLVMNRLYPYTFTPQLHENHPITTDDLERDAVFAQRVRLFGWVRERHLDIPESEAAQGFLGFAEQELLKINHYKAPRDKMICILNCCKVIFGLIRHSMGNEGGADAFVPILIFVVLRASPENMLSNVEYINRFRNPSKLQGEGGYYLSSLQGAIAFIETMDATSLSNITQEEFEHNVEKAIQQLPESPSSPRARSTISEASMSPFATSPGEEPARQLALPATAAALDGTKRFFQRTGDAAKEAVSRPLGAITRILDNMNQPGYESESGDDTENEEYAVSPRRAQPPSRLLAQLGISPAGSDVSREPTPTPHTPQHHPHRQFTPQGQGQYTPQPQTQPHWSQYPSQQPSPYASPTPYAQPPGYYAEQAHLQTATQTSHDEYAREQARLANVTTLHQMFPDLDEEIVEAVLDGCGDLGLAIDRLLEM